MLCSVAHMTLHSCSLCTYTTTRKYNLTRHIETVHSKDLQNLDIDLQNVDNTCSVCKRAFATRYTLQRHIRNNSCNHGLACPKCNKVLSSYSTKSRHVKTCNALATIDDHEASVSPHNITVSGSNNNIIHNQTNIQNNTFVLNFPKGVEDQQFAFLKDHITIGKFEQLMGNQKPAVGFSRYAGAIMQRPENRMIYKKNPNTKLCKVHNEEMWEYVLDEDAFPVLTFHMSCAALEDTHNYKKMSKRPKIDIASLLMYLDDVNTENDGNPNYKIALERLKLNIINLSQRHKIPSQATEM